MYLTIDNPQDYSVALYLRLSKEDDKKERGKDLEDDSESIKNQRILLEDYTKEQNLSVYGVYIDDGFSGTSFERPDFERMISDIESKKVNMVITKDMSRLGRDYIDTGHYMERYFPEHNVRYIALTDNIDTGASNYTGDITPFKALLNDMYAKDTSNKIKSMKRSKQAKGQFIGGKAPYGYKTLPTDKNTLVIDEPAAQIVRRIFNLALEGKSCREIAIILNAEKIPTPAQYSNLKPKRKGPYSGKWSSERVSWMLQNEVYIGNMVQGRSQKVSYKSKKCRHVPRENWIVVENTHEPIIDKVLFDKVGMLIKSRFRTRSRTYDYLLKGIIYCHECQYPLGVLNRPLADGKDLLYFVCRTYQRFTKYNTCSCHCIKVDTVTDAVMEHVRKICQQYINYVDLNEITNKANKIYIEEQQRQEKDISNLKKRLEIIKQKIDKTYEDRLSDIIDEEIFSRAFERLKSEQESIKEKIRQLESSDKKYEALRTEDIKNLVESFLYSKDYNRELLVSLVERVELTENKEVIIFFRFKELDLFNHL